MFLFSFSLLVLTSHDVSGAGGLSFGQRPGSSLSPLPSLAVEARFVEGSDIFIPLIINCLADNWESVHLMSCDIAGDRALSLGRRSGNSLSLQPPVLPSRSPSCMYFVYFYHVFPKLTKP